MKTTLSTRGTARWSEPQMLRLAAAGVAKVDLLGERGTIIGTLTTANFATTLRPPEVLAALPTTGNYLGRMVFLTTDQKLYKHAGGPAGSAGFKKDVDGADVIANSIIAGSFVAGAVAADDLAADSIVASKALISDFTNVYPDYDMEDPSYYGQAPSASYTFPEIVNANTGVYALTMPASASQQDVASKWTIIEPNADYQVSIAAWLTSAAVGSGTVQAFLQLGSLGAGKVVTLTRAVLIANNTDTNGIARDIVNILTTATERRCRFLFRRVAGGTAASRHSGPRIMRRMNGALVVDGFLTVMGMAAFGGDLQSTGYNPGVSGWRIRSTGAAEFANLVSRSWLQVGAVSDKFYETFSAGVAPTPTPGTQLLLIEFFMGAVSGANVYSRGCAFEARGKAGFTTEFVLYTRSTKLGVLGSFFEVQRWTLTDATWRTYGDVAPLNGIFDQFQYRLILAASFQDAAYPVIRNAHLVVQRTTD